MFVTNSITLLWNKFKRCRMSFPVANVKLYWALTQYSFFLSCVPVKCFPFYKTGDEAVNFGCTRCEISHLFQELCEYVCYCSTVLKEKCMSKKLSLPNCNIILCSFSINILGQWSNQGHNRDNRLLPHPPHFQAAKVTKMITSYQWQMSYFYRMFCMATTVVLKYKNCCKTQICWNI